MRSTVRAFHQKTGRSAWLNAIPSHKQLDRGITKRRAQDYRNVRNNKDPLALSIGSNYTFSSPGVWKKRLKAKGRLNSSDAVHMAHDATASLLSPAGDEGTKRFRQSGVGGGITTAAGPTTAAGLRCDDALNAAVVLELLPTAQAWDVEEGCSPLVVMPAVLSEYSYHAHRLRRRGGACHDGHPVDATAASAADNLHGNAGRATRTMHRDGDPTAAAASCGVGAVSLFCRGAAAQLKEAAGLRRWQQLRREGRADTGRVLSFFTRADGSSGFKSTHLLGLGARTTHLMLRCLASFDVWSVSPGLAPAMLVAIAEHFYHYEPVAQLEIGRMLLAVEQQHRRSSNDADDDNKTTDADAVAAVVAPHIVPKLWSSLPTTFRYFTKRSHLLDAMEVVCLSWRLSGGRIALPPSSSSSGGGTAGAAAAYRFLRYDLGIGRSASQSSVDQHGAEHGSARGCNGGCVWSSFDNAIGVLYTAAYHQNGSSSCRSVAVPPSPTVPSTTVTNEGDDGGAAGAVEVVDRAVASLWAVLVEAVNDTASAASGAIGRYVASVDDALSMKCGGDAEGGHRLARNVRQSRKTTETVPPSAAGVGRVVAVPASLVRGSDALLWGAAYLGTWYTHSFSARRQEASRGGGGADVRRPSSSSPSSDAVMVAGDALNHADGLPSWLSNTAHRRLLMRLEIDLEAAKAAVDRILSSLVGAKEASVVAAPGLREHDATKEQRAACAASDALGSPRVPPFETSVVLSVGGPPTDAGPTRRTGSHQTFACLVVPLHRWIVAAEGFLEASRRLVTLVGEPSRADEDATRSSTAIQSLLRATAWDEGGSNKRPTNGATCTPSLDTRRRPVNATPTTRTAPLTAAARHRDGATSELPPTARLVAGECDDFV